MVIREYFPGANTPNGFFSYYNYVLGNSEAEKVIVLKGGPGTGKSTFMKKIARHFVSQGDDVELLHCSSDPDSLDGVCVRERGFLILDGTAPHIIDPKCPGAVDEILNLGQCWDEEKIRTNKRHITDTGKCISENFARAYRYLAAASKLQEQIDYDVYGLCNVKGIRNEAIKLINDIGIDKISSCRGYERKAFMSAVTPVGKVCYADSFAYGADKVYKIVSSWKCFTKKFMEMVRDAAIDAGYNIRTFYCAMSPEDVVEHMYIDSLGIFITVENMYHSLKNADASDVIDIDEYVSTQNMTVDTVGDIQLCDMLIGMAESSIADAKKLHDKLEQFYIPYMDFKMADEICNDIIYNLQK